jgi:hypothetical protein
MAIDTQSNPRPLDEDLYQKLRQGLVSTFDRAVTRAESYYSSDHNNAGEYAIAVAEIAKALMILEDRKPPQPK